MAQAHLSRGDRKQALIFAKRAQRALPSGSRGWLKADDILKTHAQGMRGSVEPHGRRPRATAVEARDNVLDHCRRILAHSNEPLRPRADHGNAAIAPRKELTRRWLPDRSVACSTR